jgi:hypothetical protein
MIDGLIDLLLLAVSLYQNGTLMHGTNYDELDLLQLNICIVGASPIKTTVHWPIPQSVCLLIHSFSSHPRPYAAVPPMKY